MRLPDDFAAVVRQIEADFDVQLTDEDIAAYQHAEIHEFLHEMCHSVIAHYVPWINDIKGQERIAVDEGLARLLETETGSRLGLLVHTPEEHIRELSNYRYKYPVEITIEQYAHLKAEWQNHYLPAKDIAGMATYILSYLRKEGVINTD